MPRLELGTPVFFLTIDTLRSDELRRGDAGRDATPFLDELAASGFDFRQCYAQSSWTLPSMLSLFSSLEPPTTGVTKGFKVKGVKQGISTRVDREYFSDDHVTLTEVLRARGYSTRGFTTNALLSNLHGFPQGFDTLEESCLWQMAPCVLELAAGAIADAETAPLFLWVHLFDPHARGRLATGPRTKKSRIPNYPAPEGYESTFSLGDNPTLADQLRLGYARRIRFMDDALRGFFSRPDTKKFLDDALIVVAADHGEEFFEKKRWAHGLALTNTLVQTPLLIRLPRRFDEKRVIQHMVRNLDVAPTILDLLRLPIPAGFQGTSLGPFIAGDTADIEYVYGETRMASRNIRFLIDPSSGFKLIWNVKSRVVELYSLRDDPGEVNNIAKEEAAIARRMKEELRNRIREMESHARVEYRNDEVDRELLDQLEELGYIDR